MAPFSWNGSEFIYRRFIQPFVLKHQGEAEQLLAQATQAAKGIYDKGGGINNRILQQFFSLLGAIQKWRHRKNDHFHTSLPPLPPWKQ